MSGSLLNQAQEAALLLRMLDDVKLKAEKFLTPKLHRIVQERYPVGSQVELAKVRILQGHAYGATHARIVMVHEPTINWTYPENTRVAVDAVTLRKNGFPTKNWIRFNESALGARYELLVAAGKSPGSPRDYLLTLISELEPRSEFEEAPAP